MDYEATIRKYYPEDDDLRRLLMKHSRQVADRCLLIARQHPELGADSTFLEEAAMLHDIGIFRCHAPSIFCYGSEPYINHGRIGADILRNEGLPRHARVAERHTGTGLPGYEPQTLEEQIVCYADKFYSKSNPDRVLTVEEAAQSLRKFGEEGVSRLLAWAKRFSVLLVLVLLTVGCRTHYELTDIRRERIVVDSRYDRTPDAALAAFMAPYTQKVDSIMKPVMGTAARDMDKRRPESEISNLLSDILVWAGKDYGEKPDFGVYNIGGIRAALSKGTVTYGDINDIAPFENKIAFTTLTGEKVLQLFAQIAQRGGEGVSHGVELRIAADGKLLSARLNGQEIDPAREYRAASIDYLLQGNDGMAALADGTNVNSPQNEQDNTRYIIMKYFKAMQAEGKAVDAQVEGRIKIEP